MAKQHEFTVSKKNGPSTKCTLDVPENLTDPRWAALVSNVEEDINELAVQNLIIKIQASARDALEEGGPEAAQKAVNEYKYGARQGGGFKRPTISTVEAKKAKFTPQQLEMLRAAGVKFVEEEAPAAAAVA